MSDENWRGRIELDLEVHECPLGSWNWVLIERPCIMEPAAVIWDTTPHPSAHAAMAAGESVIASWIGRRPGWVG